MNDIKIGDYVEWKGNPYLYNAFIGVRKVINTIKDSDIVELNPRTGFPSYYNKKELKIYYDMPIPRMSDWEYIKYISQSHAIDSEFLKIHESKTKIYPTIKVNIVKPQLNFN